MIYDLGGLLYQNAVVCQIFHGNKKFACPLNPLLLSPGLTGKQNFSIIIL
jgi:hypothetical protein